MRFTSLSNYHLIDMILAFFCYSNLRRETEFELASTITLVLQANRLTKCASHPPKKFKNETAGRKYCQY